jgi:hypothetical protein
MTALVILLACVAAAAAVTATVALLALRRARQESARERAALGERVEALESRLREPAPAPVARAEHEFVITRLGEPEEAATPAVGPAVQVRLPAPAFADAVLRETVVQTASLVHGVRRALAPETRNRIRFEMRREVKRSRKARKAEVKEALREYRARNRTQSEGAA